MGPLPNENHSLYDQGLLIWAVIQEHPIIVKVLLEWKETRLDGLDESKFNDGWTVLPWVCWLGEQERTECLKMIVNDCRCDTALVNMKDKKGNTALCNAVFQSNVDAVKILLNYPGIEFDPTDRTENSTLIKAQRFRRDPNIRQKKSLISWKQKHQ